MDESSDSKGQLVWSGSNSAGNQAGRGIYVLMIKREEFPENGIKKAGFICY